MLMKVLSSLLVAASLVISATATDNGLTGHIVTDSGWRLYDYPEVRSFLLDGDAESYEGITVEFVYGRQAVLTIGRKTQMTDPKTGRVLDMMIEEESINLTDYRTQDELHAMLESKGFTKKSNDDIFKLKIAKLEKQKTALHSTHHKMLTSPLVHRKYPDENELKEKIHEKELEIMIIEEKMKDLVRARA